MVNAYKDGKPVFTETPTEVSDKKFKSLMDRHEFDFLDYEFHNKKGNLYHGKFIEASKFESEMRTRNPNYKSPSDLASEKKLADAKAAEAKAAKAAKAAEAKAAKGAAKTPPAEVK